MIKKTPWILLYFHTAIDSNPPIKTLPWPGFCPVEFLGRAASQRHRLWCWPGPVCLRGSQRDTGPSSSAEERCSGSQWTGWQGSYKIKAPGGEKKASVSSSIGIEETGAKNRFSLQTCVHVNGISALAPTLVRGDVWVRFRGAWLRGAVECLHISFQVNIYGY